MKIIFNNGETYEIKKSYTNIIYLLKYYKINDYSFKVIDKEKTLYIKDIAKILNNNILTVERKYNIDIMNCYYINNDYFIINYYKNNEKHFKTIKKGKLYKDLKKLA